jgi:hypothetical protein
MSRKTEIYTDLTVQSASGRIVQIIRIEGTLLNLPNGTVFGINFKRGPNQVFRVVGSDTEPTVTVQGKTKVETTPSGTKLHIRNATKVERNIIVEEIHN